MERRIFMKQKNLILVDKTKLQKDEAGNYILPANAEFEITPQMWMQAYALCPLDGRYQYIREDLAPYFSDFALTKYRVKVETQWLIVLICNLDESEILKEFNFPEVCSNIARIADDFNERDYFRAKEIEKINNHDVKSVEIFVAEKLQEIGFDDVESFVHFGCTSEDITNPAYAMMIQEALMDVWIPAAEKLIDELCKITVENTETAMPAHTHGQLATPTTVGKEFLNFIYRLRKSLEHLQLINTRAKFNGATGNYAAVSIAFPTVDWEEMSKGMIETLDVEFNPVTTQIESHDYMCHILDGIRHFNNVMLGLDWDMWSYISRDYLKLLVVAAEVGSSTMPQKVNPINFENSVSNVDTSNSLAVGLSNKLPVSRMQRDLSDSSSLRNWGMVLGYSLLAIKSATKGLKRVDVNKEKLQAELLDEWSVIGEAVQTMCRKYGVTDGYDQLKKLTRGKHITKEIMQEFIKSQTVFSEEDRDRLLALTPETYTGLASKIVKKYL